MRSLRLAFIAALFSACTPLEPAPAPTLESRSHVLRGKEIAEGLGSCGFCHSQDGVVGQPLTGGRLMADRYGEVRAPNITLGEGGLSGWQPNDIRSVFRKFRAPQDRPISRQLHGGFQWLSDFDLAAVVSYIRALKPAPGSTERRALSFIDRNTTGFFEASREVRGYVPSLSPQFKKEYGRYLADHVARCGVCHDSASDFITQKSYWSGGRAIRFGEDVKVAPNISGSQVAGIGGWGEDDIKTFLVSGATPDGRKVDKNFCPINFYAQAPDEELVALALYIKSVPASS